MSTQGDEEIESQNKMLLDVLITKKVKQHRKDKDWNNIDIMWKKVKKKLINDCSLKEIILFYF